MSKTATIRAHIDPVLKEEVEDILHTLGLSTTQAITLFYQQVRISQGLPFDARLPNALTQQTFADTDAGENLVRCDSADDLLERLGL